jgi:site-specific DNA-methyltransferase (adenine-specific)
LTDQQFERGLSNGLISPEMERADVNILRAKKKSKRIETPANLEVRSVRIMVGDAATRLKELPDESVHCVITSPPYWKKRRYGGGDREIGNEDHPRDYIAALADVFREVHRVLRDDGTCWVVIDDTYAGESSGDEWRPERNNKQEFQTSGIHKPLPSGFKRKELIGIPWMFAFAMREAGWLIRMENIWHKTNATPESVKDRTTREHETIFVFIKQPDYHADMEAIKVPIADSTANDSRQGKGGRLPLNNGKHKGNFVYLASDTRNRRTVWSGPKGRYDGDHFAVFPEYLIEPMILAGCPEGGIVLDPFAGAGTTGLVADRLKRGTILIELNPEYAAMAAKRIEEDAGIFKPRIAVEIESPQLFAERCQK